MNLQIPTEVDAQFGYSQAAVGVAVAGTHVLEAKHHLLVLTATHAVHPVGSGTHVVAQLVFVSVPDPAVHVFLAGSVHV